MQSQTTKPLMEELRSISWHRHERFEKLPFILSLVDGTLPLRSYIAQLRGLAVILSALEQTVLSSNFSIICQIKPILKSRFAMLCQDLEVFSTQMIPDILPAVKIALNLASEIRTASANQGRLLGFLYVLEGTTRGNQVHLPDIVKCFDLKNHVGSSFYCGYGDGTPEHWLEFTTVMNGAPAELFPEASASVIEIYDMLEDFHTALYPIPEGELGFSATALNPEAGDHPIPQNPAILQAAIVAGRRCHREFSYYERRYGERGRRFTDSDAAWLAALIDLSPDQLYDQVLWLGRVLSVRGMPFFFMERQLEILSEELNELEIAVDLTALDSVIFDIKQQREKLLGEKRFEELCHIAGGKILSLLQCVDFPDLPVILLAAYIDKLNGIPECLASLSAWLISSATLTDDGVKSLNEWFETIFLEGEGLRDGISK